MEVGSSPRVVSSKRTITYKQSSWKVHEFEVWSGERVCRAAALRMQGSLLVWAGGARQPAAGAVALAMPPASPPRAHGSGTAAGTAAATVLVGGAGAELAAGLARRLAAALARPVHVCLGEEFDRFTAPLVERGIAAEIRARPDLL